ncbi:MAG: hypothetical protein IPI81_16140 [Flavobacteriales bacterium]|nr:hypothetical protein [Flavobacteriales bacterium]MCC6936855.1 hypothetical protein [Flavobacteriales bacterium]
MATPTPTVGLAAVIASFLIPLAQVVAPAVQEIATTKQKTVVEQEIAYDKHKEQVADILLKRYIDQDANDQHGALAIIGALFPEFAVKLEEAFGRYAKDSTVQRQAEMIVAQAASVATSDLKIAREAENSGFEALAQGDAVTAKQQFNMAYEAYPTFHNVDEIRRKLDTVTVNDPVAVQRTIESIRKENAWRMPAGIKQRLDQRMIRP